MSRFFAAMSAEPEPEPEQEETPALNTIVEETEASKKSKKKNKKKNPDEDKVAPQQKQLLKVEEIHENKPEQDESEAKNEEAGAEEQQQTTAAAGKKKKKADKPKEDSKKPAKPLSKAAQQAKDRLEKKKALEEAQKKAEQERIEREEAETREKAEQERIAREKKEAEDKIKAEIKADLRAKGQFKTKKEKEIEERQKQAREMFERQRIANEIALKQAAEKAAKLAEQKQQSKTQDDSEDDSGEDEEEEEDEEEDQEEHAEDASSSRKESAKAVVKEGDEIAFDDWEAMIDESDIANTKVLIETKIEEKEKLQEKQQAKAMRGKRDDKRKKKKKTDDAEGTEDNKNQEPVAEPGMELVQETIYADPKLAFYVDSRFRCPILTILGHVDTGKTKLLDRIRKTNVQDGEEGGITQQIGASFFPQYKLVEEVSKLDDHWKKVNIEVPGFLCIDTPGHESFANLRLRGSSLCDLAILVVDINGGLENQTVESLNLLKERGTPFVVALNKIDTTPEWITHKEQSSKMSIEKQSGYSRSVFMDRLQPIITQFGMEGFNACLYWENPGDDDWIRLIPTSAITGEGIPDLLGFLMDQAQTKLTEQITPDFEKFNCSVMEVKKIDGIGTTIDAILVNGVIKEGDNIILSGFDGVIKTTVRALLTPQPLKELRVKAEYIHHKELKGSMGFKISAPGLEKAMAGTQMFVYDQNTDLEAIEETLEEDIEKVRKKIKFKTEGVCVAASTLGSLEALLVFLRSRKIPVSNIVIGDISKQDVMKAMAPLLTDDKDKIKKKEYATILAFDVNCLPEAELYAKMNKVKILESKTIYRLEDQYAKYVDECIEERKKMYRKEAVFPCLLKPIAFFNKKNPIIMGCEVLKGVLKIGTPLVVPNKGMIKIGRVVSIEESGKPLQEARLASGQVAIQIKSKNNTITAGRQFDLNDAVVSRLSRKSIDILKDFFRDEMRESDWEVVREMKNMFDI